MLTVTKFPSPVIVLLWNA